MSRAPAAISSEPSPFAIAIAPNALSGCTGIGSPYTKPATRYSSPAGSSTAVAERPLPTMRATAIGTSTPMSARAPASSRRSKRTCRSYRSPVPLDERDLLPDPLAQFEAWFAEAPGVREAMALATADSSGAPSVRMVMLKGFDGRGFVFHRQLRQPQGARAG